MTREMFKLCDRGLFVGVDYYRSLPKNKRLTSAEDARTLWNYFKSTHPDNNERKQWRLSIGRGKPPTRLEVIENLRKFTEAIPDDGAGILYFSGHAQLGASGLLLKCYDTIDTLLDDSALSLAGILRVLEARGTAGVRFLVILDCCRDGDPHFPMDELPLNVCVLYACSHGDVAVQNSQGGALTQSILGLLDEIASTSHLSVRAFHSRARQWAFRRMPTAVRGFELAGCRPNELNVPLQRSTSAFNQNRATAPTSVLKYSLENEATFRDTYCGLKIATLEWYGFSLSDPHEHRMFEDYFWRPEKSTFFCEVRIPDDGVHWNASEFLLHLADALAATPATLVLRWPGRIEIESIRWIRNIVDGEWIQLGEGNTSIPTLIWRERIGTREYRGTASLTPGDPGSEVAVRCDTAELDVLPLNCLRSTLCDIYEAFRAVQSMGE